MYVKIGVLAPSHPKKLPNLLEISKTNKSDKPGADKQIWTADLSLTKGVLYLLSYIGNLERVAGIEPASSAWKAEVLPLNYTRAQLITVSL